MGSIGKPVARVDGRAKVTGSATYAGEFHPENLAYAAIVPSPIPRGRVAAIDSTEAEAMPGVIAVLSHDNAPRLAWEELAPAAVDPDEGEQIKPFHSTEIRFVGQPLALVVAETETIARAAAARVDVTCIAEEGVGLRFDPERSRPPSAATQASYPAVWLRGEPEAAHAAAPRRIAAHYTHPRHFHNAMEPHVTIAAWDAAGKLTLWDKSQWVFNVRRQIARNFGIEEDDVRVISPFVGGAFGSALRCWPHVTMAAMAAEVVQRPVRLELSRRQLYAAVGYRPETRQTVELGAAADGKLLAIIQQAWGNTSSYEDYGEKVVAPAGVLYASPHAKTVYRLVEQDANTPTPMRGPGAVTGVFALEMAMDEMADAVGMDPLTFRLENYAERDLLADLPFSSKKLETCYLAAAERFGWDERHPRRRSMQQDGRLVGYGMASALWPAMRAPAAARVTLFANGTAVVRTAASDMGPGTYTSMTQVAADQLGLPLERVTMELGDSALPMAPVHGGSITMASVGNAVAKGCAELREELERLAGSEVGGDLPQALRDLGRERLEIDVKASPGNATAISSYAFGAVFTEVHVDPDLGTVRVPRIIAAYDGGRIVNPLIAQSQAIGGLVQGIGMALLEGGEWDDRLGRVMNANLAEYLVPVNADVEELDVTFVPGDDRRFNPLGVKGIAEVSLCGVAPAIANAVWHATDIRLRELPLTPDKLLDAGLR